VSRVVCLGPTCLDLVMRGLSGLPGPGEPAVAHAVSANPGGMANVAVALRRLGSSVALASGIGDDCTGDQLRALLEAEGVEPPPPREGGRTDLSLCMPWAGDRALVSYRGTSPPFIPDSSSDYWDGVSAVCVDIGCGLDPRIRALTARGIQLFGDTGWEQEDFCRDNSREALSAMTAFLPNQQEALALTHASDVCEAVDRLGELVPTVVVKCGSRGVVARRGAEQVEVRAPRVEAVDTTGAGDILNAGFLFGCLASLELVPALRLGCLAAAVSVTRHGSSLSAPTWGDIAELVAGMPGSERSTWTAALAAAREASEEIGKESGRIADG
jgi:sugar/nucleoside kinase (ribokinase family)